MKLGFITILVCGFSIILPHCVQGQNESQLSAVRSELNKRVAISNEHRLNYINNYKIVRGFSILNKPDSAFIFLNRIISQNKANGSLIYDPELKNLRNNENWPTIVDAINLQFIQNNPGVDTALAFQLRRWNFEDQYIRELASNSLDNPSESSPHKTDSLFKKMIEIDSINCIRLDQFVNTYGWPIAEKVGNEGVESAFLIVQHGPYEYQQVYLNSIKESVGKGDLSPQYLAMLIDRMLRKQNKKQRYGTQIQTNELTGKHKMAPVEDEKNLNKRREKMGLEPIEGYLKSFDIDYDPPK